MSLSPTQMQWIEANYPQMFDSVVNDPQAGLGQYQNINWYETYEQIYAECVAWLDVHVTNQGGGMVASIAMDSIPVVIRGNLSMRAKTLGINIYAFEQAYGYLIQFRQNLQAQRQPVVQSHHRAAQYPQQAAHNVHANHIPRSTSTMRMQDHAQSTLKPNVAAAQASVSPAPTASSVISAPPPKVAASEQKEAKATTKPRRSDFKLAIDDTHVIATDGGCNIQSIAPYIRKVVPEHTPTMVTVSLGQTMPMMDTHVITSNCLRDALEALTQGSVSERFAVLQGDDLPPIVKAWLDVKLTMYVDRILRLSYDKQGSPVYSYLTHLEAISDVVNDLGKLEHFYGCIVHYLNSLVDSISDVSLTDDAQESSNTVVEIGTRQRVMSVPWCLGSSYDQGLVWFVQNVETPGQVEDLYCMLDDAWSKLDDIGPCLDIMDASGIVFRAWRKGTTRLTPGDYYFECLAH